MFYKIRINGDDIGSFGHSNVQNIHLSVSGGPDEMYVFASAVCTEGGKSIHYDWIQKAITEEDKVEILPTTETSVAEPRNTFLMGRPKREPSEGIICDFCQRKETEVERMIHIDEHRPSICSDCVELCQEILKEKV